ncbi:MAG: polysaccharide pyruvyl transferase CsaB, partial [Clostridia bacterium]|nr:polysaccharide pyruvyl transferase CsaB [Clostridia bacterium]
KLIEQRYSVVAMANDALASYEEAISDLRPNDLMISGYYGTHNFGDDITLNAIIKNVSKQYPINSITILNHNTKDLPEDERIKVVHRFNLFKILPLMKKTKLFMLGGGSLLQDVTSSRSLFFYLFMLRHAKKYGCKTMIYANGIGPILLPKHQKQVNNVLRRVDRITIRDIISYKYLKDNGFSEHEMLLTADEAYCYDYKVDPALPFAFPETDKKILLINLRPSPHSPTNITGFLAEAIDNVCTRHNLFPVLLPVQFDQDFEILKKVAETMKTEHYLFNESLSSDDIIACISRCDYLLTERLHPMVFAARMQKPTACIVYDPKVAATAERFKMSGYALPLKKLTAQSIQVTLHKMIENEQEIKDALLPIAKQMFESAKRNSEIAGELLGE